MVNLLFFLFFRIFMIKNSEEELISVKEDNPEAVAVF